MRTPVLAILGLGIAALFASNVVSLADETGPAIWAGAGAAAIAGAFAFRFLVARPPALLTRLTGRRGLLLPVGAAALAFVVLSSSSEEAQLVSLAFFAGLLSAAIGASARRRGRT
ncbi:MAG: hypothetical protein WD689_01740 [Gaiellaceae bacterium]